MNASALRALLPAVAIASLATNLAGCTRKEEAVGETSMQTTLLVRCQILSKTASGNFYKQGKASYPLYIYTYECPARGTVEQP